MFDFVRSMFAEPKPVRPVPQRVKNRRPSSRKEALRYVHESGAKGITRNDLVRRGMNKGTASGSLSDLHKAGYIVRLSQTRENCKIYVAESYVGKRKVESHSGGGRCPMCGNTMAIRYLSLD